MLFADFDSVDLLIVPTNVANRVADVWPVNPLRIHVDEALDHEANSLLVDIQHMRSMARSLLRILIREKCENVAGRHVAAILSTVPKLRLSDDVIRLIVELAIPDEPGLPMPDMID